MLARFGWAVIRLAKEHVRTPRDFNFSTEDGDGDGDEEDDEDENDESGSGEPTRKKPKTTPTIPLRRSSRKKKASHTQLEPEVIQGMLLVVCIEYDTDRCLPDPSQRDAAELAHDLDVAT